MVFSFYPVLTSAIYASMVSALYACVHNKIGGFWTKKCLFSGGRVTVASTPAAVVILGNIKFPCNIY